MIHESIWTPINENADKKKQKLISQIQALAGHKYQQKGGVQL